MYIQKIQSSNPNFNGEVKIVGKISKSQNYLLSLHMDNLKKIMNLSNKILGAVQKGLYEGLSDYDLKVLDKQLVWCYTASPIIGGGSIGTTTAIMTGVGAGVGLVKSGIDKGEDVEIPSGASIELILDQPITISPNNNSYKY